MGIAGAIAPRPGSRPRFDPGYAAPRFLGLLSSGSRSSTILFHSEKHDSPDEGVRDGLIERELEVSLRPHKGREVLLEPLVAGYRWIETDVILEGSEVHQDAM